MSTILAETTYIAQGKANAKAEKRNKKRKGMMNFNCINESSQSIGI